ncbi:dynein heavy chain domain-containing protein 1-like [Antedon mediterranea]|uniref:dynein heavy chain domain-containing protein 1-like n=1 Tax=Antedon mediterranea TaxID=105859 RepID=UPI003AF514D2
MTAKSNHVKVLVVPSLELQHEEANLASTPEQYVMTPGDKALAWCLETRRHLDNFTNKQPSENLIANLTQEIINVFISTLQQDSYYQWMYLKEVLGICKPYSKYLQSNPQIKHYIDRIGFHLQNQKHRFEDLELESIIASMFPKEKFKCDIRNYRTPTPPSVSPSVTPVRRRIVPVILPNGKDPYQLGAKNVHDQISPRGLCFGDLKEALPSVVVETTQREAIWSEGLGLTAAALNIDLPEKVSETTVEHETSEALSDDIQSLTESECQVDTPAEEHPKQDHVLSQMTGKEAVEKFGKGRHLGKASFVYLNKAETRHFRPYDLVVVPKHKANPEEHWIISCFGIMHKVKGEPAESMELFDWHREAVLWSALTKIPFFKYFIMRKIFLTWRANRRYKAFCKTHHHVSNILLKCNPTFGSALLHVSRLLQELHTIEFLPFNKSRCYTLIEFDQITKKKKKAGEQLLDKFFEYCKLVVDTTCKDTIAKLTFCEAQTKNEKLIFSKDSLHVQRMKKEQRGKNLRDAQDEAKYLGNFVKLVDQMLLAHLLALARSNICTFLNHTMVEGRADNRTALFSAKLVFNESSGLSLFPSKDKFSEIVTSSLQGVAQVMWEKATSMDDRALAREEQTTSAMSNHSARPADCASVASPVIPVSQQTKNETPSSEKDGVSTHLTEPTMSIREDPTKESDIMGVLTPDLVPRMNLGTSIAVEGHGFIGQYNALNKGNLQEKLSQDVEMQVSYKMYFKLLNDAIQDIDTFCSEHSWLTEIHKFTESWDEDSANAWHKAQAYTIETQLSQIRKWVERVKNVDRFFTSDNQLFYVDCGVIQETLVPALNGAFRDLLDFTAQEAKHFSTAFISEVQDVVQGMKCKETTTEGFAEYAQRYSVYKLKMAALQTDVEYIKSLFEVIRLSYRSLTTEEEKFEERVWHNWEAFLLHLQEAAEFVNTQLPLKQIQLQEHFQKLQQEVERILKAATSGVFLDPSQNPTKVLGVGQKLLDEFKEVQQDMLKCSKHKEMITGQAFDTSRLDYAMQRIVTRLELWKYVEVSTYAIQEWMRQLFRKMSVQKAIDKVELWHTAAKRFKEDLPSDDTVLVHWFKLLSDFKKDLPLLLKLSSDSLKPRHWKALFVSLGQTYIPGQHFTVAELLSFNLSQHSLQVNTICNGALAEFTLETKLKQIRKVWDEKEFKLAKHIPEQMYSSQQNKGSSSILKTEVDMYTLIAIEELKYLLEDSRVTIQSMLVSPHLSELKTEAEIWSHNLQQVDELLDLWTLTQHKWLYLSNLFSSEKFCSRLHKQAVKFNSVNVRYEEVMKSVVGDPKVLSILNKRVGQKNRRHLQGDVLRERFESMIQDQDDIIKDLREHLNEIRDRFPRLYFMSDDDLIVLLTITRDKRAWVPYVKKLFPGITALRFDVPNSAAATIKTMLDMHLHSHKLEVIGIKGHHGESTPLISAVESTNDIADWFRCLEQNLKSSMGNFLQMCMEARLSKDGIAPEKILEELSVLEETKESKSKEESQLKNAVMRSFQHWLLRFPAQSVLVTEAINWERNVGQTLEKEDKGCLLKIRESLDSKIQQYMTILNGNSAGNLSFDPRSRLQLLLKNLIALTIHQQRITEGLLSLPSISKRCFEWESVLKHQMIWQQVLCAKPSRKLTNSNFPSLIDSKSKPALGVRSSIKVTSSYVFGECTVQQMGNVFNYDHEYIGPSLRAVCTPLTDRCQLGLTMAIKRFQCGSVIGPTATGKTELIHDLGQSMGRHVFSFTSCHANSMQHIIQVLKGAVKSGSWFLFEDVDNVPQGFMSVLAQQLNFVLSAYRALSNTKCSQYDLRGTSKFDKSKPVRRNSLTTLHSSSQLPDPGFCKSYTTSSAIIKKTGKKVKFKDTLSGSNWAENMPHLRQRRHSISKTSLIDPELHYENASNAIPLFEDNYDNAADDDEYSSVKGFKQLQKWKYKPIYLGNLTLGGQLVKANANFGCFMTVNTSRHTEADIPQNLRVLMRPVSIIKPDIGVILEGMLICNGFNEAKTLADKITTLVDRLEIQLPHRPEYHINLGTLKPALRLAATSQHERGYVQLPATNDFSVTKGLPNRSSLSGGSVESIDYSNFEQNEDQHQETALVHSLQMCLTPRLTNMQETQIVKNILRSIFPQSSLPNSAKEHDPVLMDAVQSQFVEDKLQATPQHVSKVLELYKNLQTSIGTILLGPAGSGKTVCYQMLARTLNKLHSEYTSSTQESHYSTKTEGKISPVLQRSSTMDRILRKGEAVSSSSNYACYNPVNLTVLYASVLTTEQMLGSYDIERQCWKDGVFTKSLRDSSTTYESAKILTSKEKNENKKVKGLLNPPSIIDTWIIMDGSIDPEWSESLNAILTENGTINLGNGIAMNRSDSTSILFETTDLSTASPATVACCSIVHFGMDIVQWRSMIDSWLGEAKSHWELSNDCLQLLKVHINDLFPSTIEFITEQCTPALMANLQSEVKTNNKVASGVQEVASFIRIMSALCDRLLLINEDVFSPGSSADNKPSPQASNVSSDLSVAKLTQIRQVSTMFVYAYIWAFGGHLSSSCADKFDVYVRNLMSKTTHTIYIPSSGSVFNWCIDSSQAVVHDISDQVSEKVKTLPSNYTIIPEIERYFNLIDLLVSSNYHVILTGQPGCGKTSLIQNLVQPRHYFVKTTFSDKFSCRQFEEFVVSKLQTKNQANSSISTGKINKQSNIIFIDDLNCCPKKKKTGEQPCLELVRQLINCEGIYHRSRNTFQPMERANFIAACNAPGSAGIGSGLCTNVLSPRITRLFSVLNFFALSHDSYSKLYSSTMQAWLEEFPAYSLNRHHELAQAILSASQDLYSAVRKQFSLSPLNPHYTFSLHDIGKVVQSMYLLSARTRGRPRHGHQRSLAGNYGRRKSRRVEAFSVPPMMRMVVRLWCHEATRTFADRLVTEDDFDWYNDTLHQVVEKHFCSGETNPGMISIAEDIQTDEILSPTLSEASKANSPGFVCESPVVANSDEEEAGDDDMTSSKCTSTPGTDNPWTPSSVSDSTEQESSNDSSISAVTTLTSATFMDQDDASETSENVAAKETSPEPDRSSLTTSSTVPCDSQLEDAGCVIEKSGGKTVVVEFSETGDDNDTQPNLANFDIPKPTVTSLAEQSSSVPLTPIRKDMTKSSSRKSSKEKKGVTFKPGLIGDAFTIDQQFNGPLIPMHQICSSDEKLSSVLFTKFINIDARRDSDKTTGYGEVNPGQIQHGLQKCINLYNEGANQPMELVFFDETLRHIAKLTRMLGTQGGNALLIGQARGTGRASLTRLAASAAKFKMFEPKPNSPTKDHSVRVREAIKKACAVAGLAGKPSVLLVSCKPTDQALFDLTALMKEGTCPGLYSKDDLDQIALQMLPGSKSSGYRSQRVEMAQERFYRRVLTNLHVVVSLHCPGGDISSLHDCFSRHPSLLHSSCCVDVYKHWSHDGLVSVATQWLDQRTLSMSSRKAYLVPWSFKKVEAEVHCISHAMAYIHQSSIKAIDKHFHKSYRFFSPLTFIEFIDLFKIVAARLGKKYMKTIEMYKKALQCIDDAYESIRSFNIELEKLKPLLADAMQESQERLQEVDKLKKEYADAKEQCRLDEISILKMEGPLAQMKKEAQDELDKVNPIYEAALTALKSLNSHDLDEIRSYRAPPAVVVNVVSALCLLFHQPYDWASGKLLINRDNFFEDLEFYEKDRMPDDVFYKLNIMFIQDASFRPEVVAVVSKAAESLCKWVHAVYAYACLHRALNPKLKQVQVAEAKLDQAKAHLGQKRVKCQEVKVTLEEQVQVYDESVKSVLEIEMSMKQIEEKISRATHLMTNMSSLHSTWKSALSQSEKHLETAPGDALLAAACVCYHGPMNERTRKELLADWLLRCRNGRFHLDREGDISSKEDIAVTEKVDMHVCHLIINSLHFTSMFHKILNGIDAANGSTSISGDDLSIPAFLSRESTEGFSLSSRNDMTNMVIQPCLVREDFSLEAILSNQEEQRSWQSLDIPQDKYAFDNALIMRACCQWRRRQWPLLLDPDQQVETWVVMISNKELQVDSDEDTLFEEDQIRTPLTSQVLEAFAQASEYSDNQSRAGFLESSGGETTETDYPQTPVTGTSIGGDTPRHPNYDESEVGLETTSQTDQSEPSTILIDPEIERPQADILIVSCDDPSIDIKLIQSITLGLTMLIKNLERRPLNSNFANVLRRNFVLGLDGKRRVTFGLHDYVCHPNFNLFLSSSVPLKLKGANIFTLPTEGTSVIDLAISPEGLSNQILDIAIEIERPEYDNQVKALEGDVRDQHFFINKVEMDILTSTIDLKVGILNEPSMLEQLLKYQQNILNTKTSLHESLLYLDQIKSKVTEYHDVSKHATLLYEVMNSMMPLNPLYYQSFFDFIAICRSIIESHRKESGILLEPKARATELMNALTHDIHKYVSQVTSQLHSEIFIFLVAVAKLRSQSQVTTLEWDLFVKQDDVHVSAMETSMMDGKPSWMSDMIWKSCKKLEALLPCFQNLTDSLQKHARQWKEYFECEPSLLSLMPMEMDDKCLTVFQKILLWKIVKPNVTRKVCRCLSVHQVASRVAKTDEYHVAEVIPQSTSKKPVIIILPSSDGHCSYNPVTEIIKEAKSATHNKVVYVISMGMTSQTSQSEKLLKECQIKGHWLVLNNCHLVDHNSNNISDLLKDMIGRDGDGIQKDQNSALLHADFRLFIITVADSRKLLPAVIIQHGVKVFCQTTSNFKSSFMYHFNSAMKDTQTMPDILKPSIDSKVLNELIFSTSLLHTVLSQRRRYGHVAMATDYQWNSEDLTSAMEFIGNIISRCDKDEYTHIQDVMTSLVYGGHVTKHQDLQITRSLVRSLIIPVNQLKQPTSINTGAKCLLQDLYDSTRPCSSPLRQYQSIFDNMKDEVDPLLLGMPPSAIKKHNIELSRLLRNNLIEIHKGPHDSLPKTNYETACSLLQVIKHVIENLAKIPDKDGDGLSHMDNYLSSEKHAYESHLITVVSDIDVLLDGINGEGALTPQLLLDVQILTVGYVPSSWMFNDKCPQTVDSWKKCLEKKQRLLTEYCSGESTYLFDLSAFSNQKLFLHIVAQDYARKEYIEFNRVQLQTQVLGAFSPPSVQPEKGVYIVGLELNNAKWDCKRACLNISTTNDQQNLTSSLPVIWLQPVDKAAKWEMPAIDGAMFKCPVYLDAREVKLYIDLPSDLDDDVCNQLRVHAVIDA